MDACSAMPLGTLRKGLLVLIVEDYAPSAMSLQQFLRLSGHDVRLAADGQSALQSIQDDKPDVVLLDLGLPGEMNGYDVARWVRRQTAAKRPLLVALTGHGDGEARMKSQLAGIDLHLVKPVDANQLQELLGRFQQIVIP
jgi:CheY-like chemotaxis protein